MTERPPLTTDAGLPSYSDWPTLIERAVDDVSRILQSELHMFQNHNGGGSGSTNSHCGSIPGNNRRDNLRCDMHAVRRGPAAPSVVALVGGFRNRQPGHLGCRDRESHNHEALNLKKAPA